MFSVSLRCQENISFRSANKILSFNLRKLSELELRKQHQSNISNRFAALENLNDIEDVIRTRKNIKENIKTSAKESVALYELKHRKIRFDEECSRFLDEKKQVKMQW